MTEDISHQDQWFAVPPGSFDDAWHLVGHDVIAPLTAVHHLVEVLERQSDAIPDDVRRAYVGTAREEMRKKIEVVQHMIGSSPPLSNRMDQRPAAHQDLRAASAPADERSDA